MSCLAAASAEGPSMRAN